MTNMKNDQFFSREIIANFYEINIINGKELTNASFDTY